METQLTLEDHQVFEYLTKNFSCRICGHILIQCMTVDCGQGHNFCKYCLELLFGGKHHLQVNCPECSKSIQHSRPNSSVDQKIDKLIRSCSELLQNAYETALELRFKKTLDHNNQRRALSQAHSHGQVRQVQGRKCESGNHFYDEISNAFSQSSPSLDSVVGKALKSARSRHQVSRTPRSSRGPHQMLPSVNINVSIRTNIPKGESKGKVAQMGEIDVEKVNILFGIYDQVLNKQNDNEPSKDLAGGDFARQEDATVTVEQETVGMKNFTKRGENELQNLIKEAEDIIRLDDHIQHWTVKMKDTLYPINSEGPEKAEGTHKVNDDLWKDSHELLKKLQDMHMQKRRPRTAEIFYGNILPPPKPAPRSAKLNPEAISDDSDAEEYDSAFKVVQECLETHEKGDKPAEITDDKGDGMVPKDNDIESKKKSILEVVEEYGSKYVEENIQFITQMRKFKEALLKIQNHEVNTAQEIKELLPMSSMSEAALPAEPGPGHNLKDRSGGSTTPRRKGRGQQNQTQNQPLTARLSSTPHSMIQTRPMTASSYPNSQKQEIMQNVRIHPLSMTSSRQLLRSSRQNDNSMYTPR